MTVQRFDSLCGETGYVVDPTSVEALAVAVSRLLGDEALRHCMGQAAIHDMMQGSGFQCFQERSLAYLAELLPVPGRQASRD